MRKPKLSPEGEVIAAYGAAMLAAFQVLVSCLEENEACTQDSFLKPCASNGNGEEQKR
jgi:hypothetical protein